MNLGFSLLHGGGRSRPSLLRASNDLVWGADPRDATTWTATDGTLTDLEERFRGLKIARTVSGGATALGRSMIETHFAAGQSYRVRWIGRQVGFSNQPRIYAIQGANPAAAERRNILFHFSDAFPSDSGGSGTMFQSSNKAREDIGGGWFRFSCDIAFTGTTGPVLLGLGPGATGGTLDHAGIEVSLLADVDGYTLVDAYGFLGDASEGDTDRLRYAMARTPKLFWAAREYLVGDVVDAPAGYGSHQKVAVVTSANIDWKSASATTLKVADALQATGDANDITILFQENAASFAAPGFTFDENAAAQGFGSPFACYGVAAVDLDGVTATNGGPVRLGASATRLTGAVTGDTFTVTNGKGTFSVGAKPGGAQTWATGAITISNSRGGITIEAENADNRVGLDHTMTTATLTSVTGTDIDAELALPGDNPVEFVKIENGAKDVTIGTITLTDASSPATGRACAVSVKEGQPGSAQRVERVEVGLIDVTRTTQGLYAEAGVLGHGAIIVDSIVAEDVGRLIDIRNQAGAAATEIDSISIEAVSGTVADPENVNLGTAFWVTSDSASASDNAHPPHVGALTIGGATTSTLTSVRERAFDVRGVRTFTARNLTVSQHVNAASGDYAGPVHNVIEADHIVLDAVTLAGFPSTNVPLELRPKLSCTLTGLDVTANGAAAALFFNGSGEVTLTDCRFAGATNALNFRAMSKTFDASGVADDALTISAHGFRHGERVHYAAGTSPIGGLTDGGLYFVLWVDANTIRLSPTIRGEAIGLIPGAGTATLRKDLHVTGTQIANSCTNLAANTANARTFDVETGFAMAVSIPADAEGTLIADLSAQTGWVAAAWPFAGDVSGTLTTPTGTIAITVTAARALVEVTSGQWATAMAGVLVGQTFTPVATLED